MATALASSLREPTYEALADLLVERGQLRPSDRLRVERLMAEGGDETFPIFLIRLGLVAERDVAEALAEITGLELVEKSAYPPESPLPEHLSERFLRRRKAVGLAAKEGGFVLAVADPLDGYLKRALELACGCPVELKIGLLSEIETALAKQFSEPETATPQVREEIDEEDIDQLRDMASEAPVIRTVNQILQRAVQMRASDIHLEPFEERLRVRYRIDGILQDMPSPPRQMAPAIISRVKLMANLNIAERRLPQDGRIEVQIQGRELDLRVSTVPTVFGESVVIRLLDREQVSFDFRALGFEEDILNRFLKVLAIPYGIILITGPTGSGKSTTLYTALSKLNTPERKIITVEDPVEYQLEGINQIHVKSEIGLTFARALRAIVRQDPDVIMIGEMRDLETARIAVQSALTGHLVLSTLHTNDAASGVTRLLDMGLEDYLITSTVNGILAQRLVRRLCDHCKEPYEVLPEVAEEAGLLPFLPQGQKPRLYRAVGCDRCNGIGYRGRLAIMEFLVVSDEIRRLILNHAQAKEIEAQALKEGMLTMYQDGVRKALRGVTTLEEVLRVTADV